MACSGGCGEFYHTQGIIIALIEIVVSIFSLLLLSLVTFVIMTLKVELIEGIKNMELESNYTNLVVFLESPTSDKVSILILPVLYFLGELILAVYLLHSIKQRNYRRCKIWILITSTLVVVGFCLFIPAIIRVGNCPIFYGLFIISNVFTFYSIWVIYSLTKLFREHLNNGYRRTPQTDIFNKL